MSFWARLRASKLFRAALWLLGIGAAPLLLYILLGPADGNPIGLGLLFVASYAVALPLFVLAVLKAAFSK